MTNLPSSAFSESEAEESAPSYTQQLQHKRLYQHIETVWDYMQMGDTVAKSDIIFVLCSNDLRVASHAAKLYHQGLAPHLLFSGGAGRFTEGIFDKTEAETFAAIARDCGVPSEAIYMETKASNTGENVTLSYDLICQHDLEHKRLLLVQKPFMERRSYATFMKQWPVTCEQLIVTSSGEKFFDYIDENMTLDKTLTALLEDYERIKTYPDLGFQIEQPIPDEVEASYQYLIQHYMSMS